MKKRIENMGHRDCHWPEDDRDVEGRRLYCAAHTAIGSEYCPHHRSMMFRSEAVERRHRQLYPSFNSVRKV